MRKNRLYSIALLIAGSVFGLAIPEAGLRGTGYIVLRLRDPSRSPPDDRERQFTILCIGESTTYCGDHSCAYPRQLEKILSDRYPDQSFQVINKGKPGCNSGYIAEVLSRGYFAEKSGPGNILSP